MFNSNLSFYMSSYFILELPGWLSDQESAFQCRRGGLDPWVRKIPLEKEMATHSSILAWAIPWTGMPGQLWSMRSQRVRRDLETKTTYFILHFLEMNFLPFPVRMWSFLRNLLWIRKKFSYYREKKARLTYDSSVLIFSAVFPVPKAWTAEEIHF